MPDILPHTLLTYYEPLDQLKRSKSRCLTVVSCSHRQIFQVRCTVWCACMEYTEETRCMDVAVHMYSTPSWHVGTQHTDAIVLYSTSSVETNRTIQFNSTFFIPLCPYPLYEYGISIGRVIPIRQSETPEVRTRADIINPHAPEFRHAC